MAKKLSAEQFLRDRKMVTTEVVITVKCQVVADAATDKEAKDFAKAYALRRMPKVVGGRTVGKPSVKTTIIKRRELSKAERDEILAAEGYLD